MGIAVTPCMIRQFKTQPATGYKLLVLAFLASASALVACSSSVTPSGQGGTGTGAGGHSSSSSGTGGHGGDNGQGGGYCDVQGDGAGPTVVIRIVNKTAQDLYLGSPTPGCSGYQAFNVLNSVGTTLKSALGECEFTCSQIEGWGSNPVSGCACAGDCAAPTVTKIAPGGVYTTQWDGSIYSSANVPKGCAQDGCTEGPCVYQQPIAGPIDLQATAYPDVTGCDPAACSCAPGADGTCVLPLPATVTGAPSTAIAKVANVTASTVDIVFDTSGGK